MEDRSNIIKEAIEYRKQLEKENAELKAENDRLKKENFDYNIACTRLEEYGKCLKQTLQEIKKIAKQCMNKDTCYDCEYYDDCYIDDAEIPTYDICKLLIQIITKAESEEV